MVTSRSQTPVPVRHVDDVERRARMASRHALAPQHRLRTVDEVVRAMTVLHATEAYSIHLAVAARAEGLGPDDVEQALNVDRSVVRQLAMRRTLFVFPRDLLPAAWGSAAARTAQMELKTMHRVVQEAGLTDDPEAWWDEVSVQLLERVSQLGQVNAREASTLVPALEARVTVGAGRWTTSVPLGPRAFTLLGAQGRMVRAGNVGHWRLARPTWAVTGDVLPDVGAPLKPEEGYAELVRRWLHTFGPGTETDVVWWLGATKTAVRRALADVGAVPVSLDSGDVGWVLPDDVEPPEPHEEPYATLLPVLDPTLMGWKQRDFYLDPADVPYLFDTNGNGGTTAWWNGRVVGCWVQDDDGRVRVLVLPQHVDEVGSDGMRALEAEAERLSGFLGGTVIASVYKSRQMKGEVLP